MHETLQKTSFIITCKHLPYLENNNGGRGFPLVNKCHSEHYRKYACLVKCTGHLYGRNLL